MPLKLNEIFSESQKILDKHIKIKMRLHRHFSPSIVLRLRSVALYDKLTNHLLLHFHFQRRCFYVLCFDVNF
jgi:hypothetical protein